ncbi:hypothetical protein ACFYSC_33730 [Streptosporangium sp. NPDC004379]|uniref:hypothetical protein n=1 Tax=Streptosporangium sp. NPDC004379 TaxID=3366189 RepID=UPI0036CDA862
MRFPGALAVVPLALTLTLTGCAADGDDGPGVASANGGGTAATDAPAARQAAPTMGKDERNVRFARCMRENGVPMEDPQPGRPVLIRGDAGDRGTVRKAVEACREFQPAGGTGAAGADASEKLRRLARCMRDNGVPDFPDPEPGDGIRLDKKLAEDPDFPAAQRRCELESGGS